MRGHGQNHPGIQVLHGGHHRGAHDRLRPGGWHAVAHLDLGRLVVGHHDVRRGQDVELVVACQHVQHGLDRVAGTRGERIGKSRHDPADARNPGVELAAPSCAVGEQPLQAILEFILERHFGDRHFDQHLPRRRIEFLERRLDLRIAGGSGENQQRVVFPVGDHPHLARRTATVVGDRKSCPGRGQRSSRSWRGCGSGRAPEWGCGRASERGCGCASEWGSGWASERARERTCDGSRRQAGSYAGSARRAGCRCLPAAKSLGEQSRQMLGLAVLDVIDEQAHAPVGSHAIEAFEPHLGLFQVVRLRGNDQETVEPLDGNEAHYARQRTQFLVADDLVQLRIDRFHIGALQGEQPDRHSAQPIDIEQIDGIEHVPDFVLGAGDNQQIAQLIDLDGARIRSERLEYPAHFLRANEFQRHDLHRKTGKHTSHLGRHRSPYRGGGHDLEDSALLDQNDAVHAQHGLERGQHRAARQGPGGAECDQALHPWIDDIAFLENLRQHRFGDVANIRRLEVQGHVGRFRGNFLRPGWLQQYARSPEDLHALGLLLPGVGRNSSPRLRRHGFPRRRLCRSGAR